MRSLGTFNRGDALSAPQRRSAMLARAPIASKFAVAGASRVDLRARGRAPAVVPRASAPGQGSTGRTGPTSSRTDVASPDDVRALMPRTVDRARLVAQVSAKAAPAPPAESPPSAFVLWCRGNWGYFAALQTVALIGASYNGRLARKRRLEIADINDKLRAMMAKYEGKLGSVDDDDVGPASEALAAAKAALVAGDFDAAAGKFSEAKAIAQKHGDSSAVLSGAKGTATALMRAGQLRAAVAELESVVDLAVSEGDSSVYGMLGDAHTDLAELGKAGAYYDKCLAMD